MTKKKRLKPEKRGLLYSKTGFLKPFSIAKEDAVVIERDINNFFIDLARPNDIIYVQVGVTDKSPSGLIKPVFLSR